MKSKIAVVTGVSHSNGIGAAVCCKLAEAGTDIFFTYWKTEQSWAILFQKEIEKFGVRCNSLAVDLAEEGAYLQLLDTVQESLGFPTILVNNAAHSARDGYEKLDTKTLDDHYKVNMRATFMLSVEFARRFKTGRYSAGRIINMTSGQDQGPMIEELAYGATKGAISAFTLSLSAELAPLGITVNAVNPGPTDTGWMTYELKKRLESKFLMGRAGKPEDAANLITFLTKEEAGWVTGQVIHSEGAFYRS
ncbi:SDR family oxidoreductase [Lentibacillus salinarum]|uniref:SDR family oxidoreductase n=1 Tax=Lentibacillus salinarum TaxID=446820 RepID=A0ABW3ZUY7_9BACI